MTYTQTQHTHLPPCPFDVPPAAHPAPPPVVGYTPTAAETIQALQVKNDSMARYVAQVASTFHHVCYALSFGRFGAVCGGRGGGMGGWLTG
jgi:hypothetical protein